MAKKAARQGKVIAYLRVSTDTQTTANQELALRRFAESRNIHITDFISVNMSSRKSEQKRRLDELFGSLEAGDTLIVTELSRLARSVEELLRMVKRFIDDGIRLVSVKENIDLNGSMDIQTKVMVNVFSLLAEIGRDLVSLRTKEGLARTRAAGTRLGRPKGPGKSKLDGLEGEIANLMGLGVTKSSMQKMFGISRCALDNFLKTRKVKPAANPVPKLQSQRPQATL